MEKQFDEAKAKKAFEAGIPQAEETIKSESATKGLIEKSEKKLKSTSKLFGALEYIPLFVSLLKSYAKKEYTDIPMGSILGIVSALLYWVSPVDLIPDFIPFVGYVDDAAVVLLCLNLVKSDLDDYKAWLEKKEQQEKANNA